MDTYVKRAQCYNGQRVGLLIPDFGLVKPAYLFL